VRQYLEQRLERYRGQLVPSERVGDADALQQAAQNESTQNADVFVRLARLHKRAGNAAQALAAVNKALELEPGAPAALLLKAQWSLEQGNALLADALIAKLLDAGHDGYEVQILRARIASAREQPAEVEPALQRARQYDPWSAEPLWGLLEFADTPSARLPLLTELAKIEEHRPEVFTELSELLLAQGRVAEAVTAAESAVFAGAESAPTHTALGQALARAGRDAEARHAFESALLCPGPTSERSRAHLAYEGYLRSRGRVAEAELQRQAAQRVLGESDSE
jgi:Flp pilus assembly protein TadD